MLGLDNMTHEDWEVGFRDNKKEEGMVNVKSWGMTTKNLFNPCSRSGFSALFIHLRRRKGCIYSLITTNNKTFVSCRNKRKCVAKTSYLNHISKEKNNAK